MRMFPLRTEKRETTKAACMGQPSQLPGGSFYFLRLLVLLFIKEEVFFTWIIRPNVFHAFVNFTFIFHLLQVFDYFQGSA